MLSPVSTSTSRRSFIRWSAAGALLLALLLVPLRDAPPIPALPAAHPASASASGDAMAALPAQLRAQIFAQFGQDDPAAQLHASAGGAIGAPAIGGLAVTFDATTLRLGGEQPTWQWTLRGWGRAAALAPPARASALVQANRARYALGALEAWYIAGPDRLEQGWTIAARPAGAGPLLLTFAEAGQLRAELAHDGQGLDLRDAAGVSSLRYDGLLASDASGRRLPARFTRQGDGLAIAVDDSAASYPLTIDPLVQVARLSIPTSGLNDMFGFSVALSADGSTLVVGAYQNNGGGVQRGAVYVYTRPAGGWASINAPAAILTNAAFNDYDGLGWGVAVTTDGSTIVASAIGIVGYPGDEKGSISIYTRPAGGWVNSSTPIATLTNAALGQNDSAFGEEVALSADGSTLVAATEWGHRGAYVYTRPAGGWASTNSPTATLTNPADKVGRGVQVSADGSTIVTNGRELSNLASVYTRPAGGWASTSAPTAMLGVNDGVNTDPLDGGVALSADGSTIVAAAHAFAQRDPSYVTAAYVFTRPAGGWATTAAPTAALTATHKTLLSFSSQLALSANGSTLVAGDLGTGMGYVFTKPAGGWVGTSAPTATITPTTDVNPFRTFVALSADGSTLIASNPPFPALHPVNGYTKPAGGWVGINAPSTEFADADKSQLGAVVALSADGNTLAAGSPGHAYRSGAVYLFTKPAGGWATTKIPTATLTNRAGAEEDYLGWAVALSADGSTLVAGAPQNSGGGTERGAAYVYTRPPGGWATTDLPTATITYAAGVDYNALGFVVALSADGSTLVLRGEDAGGTGRGALYVYTRPAGGWASTGVPAATLTKGLGTDGERLSAAIALSADGSTLVVGAPSKDINQNPDNTYPGAAYVYTRPAGGWATTDAPTATITYAAGAPGDGLGSAVALSADGSTIVAARETADDTRSGAAYVYVRPAGGWATTDFPIAWLTVAGAVGDWFGWVLALNADGSTLVAGAPHAAAGGTARGALYSYTKPAGSWAISSSPTATFTATPGLDANQLGWAVALSADGRTLVGGTAPAALFLPAYYNGIYIFRDRSTNATLSGLALSQGTLSPAFAIGTRAYTAKVAYSVSSVTVTPTVADADATVTVNGAPVRSGSASGAISLRPGPNLITVVVTAEDPAIRTTTTITITRPARVWLPVIVR